MTDTNGWTVRDRFFEKKTQWLTLVGEHLINDQAEVLEYWRVEKADSVIILPIHQNHLLFSSPQYRPGIGNRTLDFPGGRLDGKQPEAVVPEILQRELRIEQEAIAEITPLNPQGWSINSSFSNQKLFGFVVNLSPDTTLSPENLGQRTPITPTSISKLLKQLTCLQCRTVLLEWWVSSQCLD